MTPSPGGPFLTGWPRSPGRSVAWRRGEPGRVHVRNRRRDRDARRIRPGGRRRDPGRSPVQSVDLTDRADALLAHRHHGGPSSSAAAWSPDAEAKIRADGAFVFPPVPGLPFDPYRGLLYTPDALYEGLAEGGYEATPDARAYGWFQLTKSNGDVFASMLRALHDDAVSDALDEHLVGARVVGVMGGHAMARGSEEYLGAAALGRELARSGLTVATGGGPGAMEAANLGAYAAPHSDAMLVKACELLAAAPLVQPVGHRLGEGRLRRARALARTAAPPSAIPTWFYGHEPPNAFADHIAKYFANALREDGLLARSTAGVIFLPGAAGTVQEIFDNATPELLRVAFRAHADGAGEPRALDGEAARLAAAAARWRRTGRWSPVSRSSTRSRKRPGRSPELTG